MQHQRRQQQQEQQQLSVTSWRRQSFSKELHGLATHLEWK
jgi:hypothetical protein